MKISKLSPAICFLALCVSFISISARAQDNPAQAAARAALEEKFRAAAAPAATSNTGVLSDPQPAATVKQPSVSTGASALDIEARTKAQAAAQARAAADKQSAIAAMADTEALKAEQASATLATNAQVKAQAAAQAMEESQKQDAITAQLKAEALKARQDAAQLVTVAQAAEQVSLEAQKQADSQRQAILAEQKRAAVEAQAQAKAEKEAEMAAAAAANSTKGVVFKPITSPALPITAAQQTQLDALLDLYRADRISPAEYQTQRAAILAKP